MGKETFIGLNNIKCISAQGSRKDLIFGTKCVEIYVLLEIEPKF